MFHVSILGKKMKLGDNGESLRTCLFALKYIEFEYIGFIPLVVKNEDQRLIFKNEHQIIFPSTEIESKE